MVHDAATARRFVTSSLAALSAPPEVVAALKLAVSELASNALRNSGGAVRVSVGCGRTGWSVEVIGGHQPPDHRLWDPLQWTLPDQDRTTGRGLGLVRALVDRVWVDDDTGEARIRCSIRRRPGDETTGPTRPGQRRSGARAAAPR